MTQPAPVPTPPPGDPAPVPTPPPTPTPTPPADPPLGPAGERALAAERAERKKLEQQIAALSPLQKLAEALGAGTPAAAGRSEVELLQERFAQHEQTVTEERAARWRAEIANERGLSLQQAARLQGGTREELLADADALLALFPATQVAPRTPAPDPSQGARGAGTGVDLEAQITEAQKAGDYRKVIALQKQKLQK